MGMLASTRTATTYHYTNMSVIPGYKNRKCNPTETCGGGDIMADEDRNRIYLIPPLLLCMYLRTNRASSKCGMRREDAIIIVRKLTVSTVLILLLSPMK